MRICPSQSPKCDDTLGLHAWDAVMRFLIDSQIDQVCVVQG